MTASQHRRQVSPPAWMLAKLAPGQWTHAACRLGHLRVPKRTGWRLRFGKWTPVCLVCQSATNLRYWHRHGLGKRER